MDELLVLADAVADDPKQVCFGLPTNVAPKLQLAPQADIAAGTERS
jgi:hypothetical protein